VEINSLKPAPFAYHAPTSIDDALRLLAEYGDEAKPLAGGQSLVPLMNFRLARPAHLVDLNRLADLAYIRADNGAGRIGAMTRQREIERSPLVMGGWPLLVEATGHIGHVHIRNRGTLGGSLAHADPAAELPAVMLALDAQVLARNARGARMIAAEDLFQSHYATCLAPDELLTEIRVPAVPPRSGWAFEELSRRHGDFALVGVAALVALDASAAINRARLVFSGAGPTPMRASAAEAVLTGSRPSEALFREAGELTGRDLDPDSDVHASAAYRREIAAVLTRRALARAASSAAASAA
jgi:aerobic carbon-monoxide dehydrogenase medium subunit